MDHETYFHENFPGILLQYRECIEVIRFLHEQGEKHGDIRRDHILIDRNTKDYRWIDFDYNYRHRENIYGYDLFGLGNILAFLVGKGDVLLPDLKRAEHPAVSQLRKEDLIAVDGSDNSRRAVSYVAQLLGGVPDSKVTNLHIIQDPEEDYFPSTAEKDQWFEKYRAKMGNLLESYRQILIEAGFDPAKVSVRSPLCYCPSLAECILTERDETKYDTIVVGPQGLSRKEQFLFGSVSSKIVNHAGNCTVWVVS